MVLLTKIATRLKRTPILFWLPLVPRPPLSSVPNFTHSYTATHSSLLSSNSSNPKTHYFPLHTTLDRTPYDTLNVNLEADDTNKISQVDGVVEIFRNTKNLSEAEVVDFLHESNIELTGGLVCSVIWALRHEWKLALLVFKSGEKCGCNDSRAWDLMIWVLGQHSRFSTAWRLIRNMLRSSMDARQALLILIESYADANLGSKAIETFQAMEKLRLRQDMEALHTLLRALCKNGNIEEAEEFMQLNKKHLPLCTDSFNIILNGWCNICVDLFEAKRVWREMCGCCIIPDATSYAYMISCFSKASSSGGGDLCNSLRLYDEMKKKGWTPCLDVYNSLIYALARESCFNEALRIVEKIKEAGLHPDSTTYSSMVVGLCQAHKVDEARGVLRDMAALGLNPTRDAYHALVAVEDVENVDVLLKEMKKAKCGPYAHTFFLVINRLLLVKEESKKQPEDAMRMWVEMMKYNVCPDAAVYNVMVKGLARCGWLAKAKRFYDEMIAEGFPDDPAIKLLFTKHYEHKNSNKRLSNK